MGFPIVGQVHLSSVRPAFLSDDVAALQSCLSGVLSGYGPKRRTRVMVCSHKSTSGYLVWEFPTVYISQKLRVGKYLGMGYSNV